MCLIINVHASIGRLLGLVEPLLSFSCSFSCCLELILAANKLLLQQHAGPIQKNHRLRSVQ